VLKWQAIVSSVMAAKLWLFKNWRKKTVAKGGHISQDVKIIYILPLFCSFQKWKQ
jgi:hypothetical protein